MLGKTWLEVSKVSAIYAWPRISWTIFGCSPLKNITPLIILYSFLIEFGICRLSYSLLRWSARRDSCNKGGASFREDLIPGSFRELG